MEEKEQLELEKYRKRYGKFGDIRNIFHGKATMNDWITLALLAGLLVMAYFYNRDTHLCRETLSRIGETACNICNNHLNVTK